MDLIRCAYIANTEYLKPETKVTPVLEHMDGSPVSKNEIDPLVDIGRDRWKYKYPVPSDDVFRWRFKNYSPDIANRKHQQYAFAIAFRTIGLLTKQKYRFTTDSKAHFNHEFVSDPSVFSGASVLAHAYLYYDSMNKKYKGLIQYNDNNWHFSPYGDALPAYLLDPEHYSKGDLNPDGSYKTLKTQPLIQIDMHEGCHAHGYRHDMNSPESLMAPYVKDGYSVNRKFFPNGLNTEGRINQNAFTWTDDDILRWGEGYELRNLDEDLLEYFRNRRYDGLFEPGTLYRIPN